MAGQALWLSECVEKGAFEWGNNVFCPIIGILIVALRSPSAAPVPALVAPIKYAAPDSEAQVIPDG